MSSRFFTLLFANTIISCSLYPAGRQVASQVKLLIKSERRVCVIALWTVQCLDEDETASEAETSDGRKSTKSCYLVV